LAPQASPDQIEYAVASADSAAAAWAEMPRAERCAVLASCAAVLRKNLEALATLQTNESGRPISETRIEVFVAAASFDNAARLLDVGLEEEISDDGEKRVVVRRSPLGVVAVIAPWNAPIVLAWKPTSCALACGNTVVLKPAPQTPLTTLRIGELLRPLLPPGVLNVVVGSDTESPRPGEILTSHPLVRKVVFTGSTTIGSKVMEACAKDFKRVLLELGGNDAAIILPDVDITKTAEGVFKAAFFNNGQTCCAIKRIYVQESIFDEFVDALVARARKAKIGNGLREGIELGPLANNTQLELVTKIVEDARSDGGRVLCGGGATAGPPGDEGSNTGLFYLPTIVVGVAEGSRLVDEEQFGPVVPVMPYTSIDEAIRRANGTQYGLGASVWSGNIERANELADRLRAGTVWVNRHCEFIRNAPFGGFGSSGIGRAGDLGQRDLAEYTEMRTVCLAKAPLPEPAQVPPTPLVHVETRASELLCQRIARISSRPSENADAFEVDAEEAIRTFPFQPLELRKALQSVAEADGPACIVIRGLPTSPLGSAGQARSAAATPPVRVDAKASVVGEALLFGATACMGARAFAYRGHCGEQLARTLSEESDELLGWHRSGRSSPAYDMPRRFFRSEERVPEFTAAFCVHSEQPVSCSFVDFRTIAAAAKPEDVDCLQSSPLSFFDEQRGLRTEPICVASPGAQACPTIFDLREDGRFQPEGSPGAVEAYLRVCKVAAAAQESLDLESGDLVVFNNKRCLHSWSAAALDVERCQIQTLYASRSAKAWETRLVQ